MRTECCLENPISLKKIKNEKLLEKYSLILKADVWKQGLLLLRRGLYLSEELIDKLINFGIEKINIDYYEDCYADEEKYIEMLKQNFLKNQVVFIFDKNIRNSVYLANILMHAGYKRGNIFALSNNKYVSKYFKNKRPDYLIIDYESNSENIYDILKEVDCYTHIFLTVDESTKESSEFVKFQNNTKLFKINLITKPLSLGVFLRFISDSVDSDFSDLLKNKNNELVRSDKRRVKA